MTERVTNERIVAAYEATGSVWKTGRMLGISGQSAHERLRAIGHRLYSTPWTTDEVAEMASLLEAGVPLGEVARRLGRPFAGAACKASRLGLRAKRVREVKVPRGAGYDKQSMKRHLDALDNFDGPATRYARANGLAIEMFVQAAQRHFPDQWDAYVRSHSALPSKTCVYCDCDFIPANARQTYCTRKCASDARADRNYFGGRRRETVGLAEGVCQLCGRHGHKGLSSHHVLGKENDPDNEVLVALCQGCHKLVTLAASRKFIGDEAAWESFISLVWLRRYGAEMPPDHDVLHVTVDIETYLDTEEIAA